MILVLRALGIGDLCVAVPALRALRAAHPDEDLVLAAPRWLAPLVRRVGVAARQVPVEGLAWPEWPAAVRAPRLAVNLHGSGPQSHRLLARARPGRLLAFACPAAGHFGGPQWTVDDPEHETRRWCRLLHWYGIPADPTDLSLPRPISPAIAPARGIAGPVPVGATVVHPGAKAAERCWPARRFAEVAAALVDAGHEVVVTGSAGERELVDGVVRASGLPDSAGYAGRLDVAELATLVAYARLVVSNDTGVGHLATGYGTASVVLFGPTLPAQWGPPPGNGRHQVLARGGGGGALPRIPAAEVLAAAARALAAAGSPASGGLSSVEPRRAVAPG